jgi:hypothetical protein
MHPAAGQKAAPLVMMLTSPTGLALLSDTEEAIAGPSPDVLNKYPDSSFETVLGTWILDHFSGVMQTVQDIVRITDRSAAQPRIMLLQDAPWNEVLRF